MYLHGPDRSFRRTDASGSPLGWGRGLLVALLLASTGCSFIIDSESNQCVTDADCVRFGTYPVCQEGICVPSGLGPPGCFKGDVSTEAQYLNQCTTSQCIPFDNCARLGLCNGAALPPLVPKP